MDLEDVMGISKIETNMDIVIVIDLSHGMEPLLSQVRRTPWCEMITENAISGRRDIDTLRFKVIWYSNLKNCCDDSGYGESKFFVMPQEESEFYRYLNNLHTTSYVERSSGLEALEHAIDSDWNQNGDKIRHVVVLFTDKKAHPLELPIKSNNEKDTDKWIGEQYLEDGLRRIFEKWQTCDTVDGIREDSKLSVLGRRLVLFAPSTYPWITLEYELEYIIRYDVALGQGGREINEEDIQDVLFGYRGLNM